MQAAPVLQSMKSNDGDTGFDLSDTLEKMGQPQNTATRFHEQIAEDNPNKQFRLRLNKISEIFQNNELIGDQPMSTKELNSFILNISQLMEGSLNIIYHAINLSIAQFSTASKIKENEAMRFMEESCIKSTRSRTPLANRQICHHSLISELIQNIDESTFIKRKGFLKDFEKYNDTYLTPGRKWKVVDEILQTEQTDHSFQSETMSFFKHSTYQKRIHHQHVDQPKPNGINVFQEVDEGDDRIDLKEKLLSSYNDVFVRQETSKSTNHTNQSNKICAFCQKQKHKIQLHCPRLKKLKPTHIRSIMRQHGIECEMCLGKHKTEDCISINGKTLNNCLIKENGVECNRYHCRFLHEERSRFLKTKFLVTNKKNKKFIEPAQKPWRPYYWDTR